MEESPEMVLQIPWSSDILCGRRSYNRFNRYQVSNNTNDYQPVGAIESYENRVLD